MDIRVFNNVVGGRPHNIFKSDCPLVARAIVAVVRHQARVGIGVYRNMRFVRLTGQDFDMAVLGEDWEKILPFIQDGTFDPSLVPVAPQVGYINPAVHYDTATLDARDIRFYERVLYILEGLFPEDYPTSNL